MQTKSIFTNFNMIKYLVLTASKIIQYCGISFITLFSIISKMLHCATRLILCKFVIPLVSLQGINNWQIPLSPVLQWKRDFFSIYGAKSAISCKKMDFWCYLWKTSIFCVFNIKRFITKLFSVFYGGKMENSGSDL